MRPSQTAEIVLVRAVEESRPDAIAPATLVDAVSAAGDLDDETVWLARRASYLLEHPLLPYRPLVTMCETVNRGTLLLVAVPMFVGLLSNYLGPSSRIHVLYNAIAVLILWNIVVYALLAARRLAGRSLRSRLRAATRAGTSAGQEEEPASPGTELAAAAEGPGLLVRWAIRRLVPGIWLRLNRTAGDVRRRATDFAAVGRRFWSEWITLARPSLALATRRAFHWAAVGLTVGAVIGMYVRGLFFDYNVVWSSTFIKEPHVVGWVLRCLLGPAAVLLGQPLPDATEAALLMTPGGAPAARWIHLYAASALAFVILPRMALAVGASIRRRLVTRKLVPDVRQAYYRRLLDAARQLHVQRVEDAIRTDVQEECAKFSSALAGLVCERLYDRRIVPRLERYGEEGGSIGALEEAISKECEAFRPELEQHLVAAQQDFERSLSRRIEWTIGARLAVLTVPTAGLTREVGVISEESTRELPGMLGHRLADLVGASVSTAVAVVAGTLGGGFGKALGTAILVGLVGTTGPVGFVIGALSGLVIAGAGWWLGRETLTRSMKELSLPSLVARATLWRLGKIITDGREKCHAAVKDALDAELEPLTPQLAEQIWHSVKPLLGEQHLRAKPPGEDAGLDAKP